MNTLQTKRPARYRPQLALRLWGIMMALVLFSVAFMWLVQIFLLEHNYIDSATADIQSRLEPVMEDLGTEDLATNSKLIPYLSKSTNGKMMLLNTAGELLAMYSYGHPIDLEVARTESLVWSNIRKSREYEQLLLGEQYKKLIQDDNKTVALEIGIPVTYDGSRAYVILYHALDEVHTVLRINRGQLILLSVLLTLAAALLAAVFSRQFIRPIHTIKATVDRLAAGELSATPGLMRGDELGQLSDSVEQLGQALQRVDVLRKEVIANVSHELRSPLALIVGYSEMVRDISWRDDNARENDMNLIIREAKRMSEMVSDILDYSQFQSGYIRLRMDPYNLCEIVESEIAHCEPSAKQHGIGIDLLGACREIPVRVDALKLSQVMRNLLYNAINHTRETQRITVRLERRGAAVRISISNPGSPIPQEERALIWERYHRSQHKGGRKQGTGLGLSIVSTILTAHGMPYGVDCTDGSIVFWFDCPVEAP